MDIRSSEIKNVSLWKSFHLDDILDQGDRLVKYLKATQTLSVENVLSD